VCVDRIIIEAAVWGGVNRGRRLGPQNRAGGASGPHTVSDIGFPGGHRGASRRHPHPGAGYWLAPEAPQSTGVRIRARYFATRDPLVV
jgi:hypothetical protein